VDAKAVATQMMEHTIPIIMQFDETFDVGADTGTPVDDKDYAEVPSTAVCWTETSELTAAVRASPQPGEEPCGQGRAERSHRPRTPEAAATSGETE
jgi:hypothetical protein